MREAKPSAFASRIIQPLESFKNPHPLPNDYDSTMNPAWKCFICSSGTVWSSNLKPLLIKVQVGFHIYPVTCVSNEILQKKSSCENSSNFFSIIISKAPNVQKRSPLTGLNTPKWDEVCQTPCYRWQNGVKYKKKSGLCALFGNLGSFDHLQSNIFRHSDSGAKICSSVGWKVPWRMDGG